MSWDVIGHDWAVELLAGHVAAGHERHAYLFTGPPGVGRRTLVLRFAEALDCQNPPAPGQPCRVCRACSLIERMQHPDLFVIQRDPEKSEVAIDQVRSLQHSLSLAPYEARYRVGMLLNFHCSSENAQNALLKTLEDAPSKVVLMLTADTLEGLLPTIVSRCEVVRLRPMALDSLSEHLQSSAGLSAQDARLLAHISGGRLGQARRLLGDPGALEQRQAWFEAAIQLMDQPRRERFMLAESVAHNKDEFRDALASWQSFWRDVQLCAAGAETPLVNLDHETEIRQVAEQVELPAAGHMVAAIQQSLERLDANVNPRLIAEVLMLDWPRQ